MGCSIGTSSETILGGSAGFLMMDIVDLLYWMGSDGSRDAGKSFERNRERAGATPGARRDQGREAVRQVGSLPPFPRFCPRPDVSLGTLYLIGCSRLRIGGCGKPKGKP